MPAVRSGARASWMDSPDTHPLHVGAVGAFVFCGLANSQVAGAPGPAPARSMHKGHRGSCSLSVLAWTTCAWAIAARLVSGSGLFWQRSINIFASACHTNLIHSCKLICCRRQHHIFGLVFVMQGMAACTVPAMGLYYSEWRARQNFVRNICKVHIE